MYRAYEHLENRLREAEETCSKEHLAQCLPMSSALVLEEWMKLLISALASVTKNIHAIYGHDWNLHIAVDEIRLAQHKEDECPYFVTDFDAILCAVFECMETHDYITDDMLEEAAWSHLRDATLFVFDIDLNMGSDHHE